MTLKQKSKIHSILPYLEKDKVKLIAVDDDSAILGYLTEYFSSQNLDLITFDNPEVALAKIESQTQSAKDDNSIVDVAFVDIKMPSINGIEFARKLRKLIPDCTIILMSAFTDVQDAVVGIKEGAYDYIEKPFNIDRLEVVVRNVLRLKTAEHSAGLDKAPINFNGVLCKSQSMATVYELVRRAAPTDSNVLITGESGVGKELIARAIHENSIRSAKPFISINCSAIPESLLESELFGHSKGSFTGAHQERSGLFAAANEGTLFLDEIGDLNLSLQAKLLRVVQERKIRPVGSDKYYNINVRLVSATNKNLTTAVNENLFREDLYYRLNVIPIHVPPLRQRKEDIIILANFFLRQFNEKLGTKVKSFSSQALEKLLRMRFKGNVRELQNVVERSYIFSNGDVINESDIPTQEEPNVLLDELTQDLPSLRELENLYIKSIMERYQWNKQVVAKVLGLSRRTLYRRLEEAERNNASVN